MQLFPIVCGIVGASLILAGIALAGSTRRSDRRSDRHSPLHPPRPPRPRRSWAPAIWITAAAVALLAVLQLNSYIERSRAEAQAERVISQTMEAASRIGTAQAQRFAEQLERDMRALVR